MRILAQRLALQNVRACRVIEKDLRLALPRLHSVPAQVGADSEQPGPQAAFTPESAEGLKRPQESLLLDVIGIIGTPEQVISIAEHMAFMFRVDLSIRVQVTGSTADQHAVFLVVYGCVMSRDHGRPTSSLRHNRRRAGSPVISTQPIG